MFIKCLVFIEGKGNMVTLHQIANARSPAECKALGRSVSEYKDAVWKKLRYNAMRFNLIAKFAQNQNLKDKLLATGDNILVEASPTDCVWGVGLRENDPRIRNPKQWRGQNLLGKCLMEVRAEFIDSAQI